MDATGQNVGDTPEALTTPISAEIQASQAICHVPVAAETGPALIAEHSEKPFISDEMLRLSFYSWIDSPVETRTEKNATQFALKLGCEVGQAVALQKEEYAEWLATKPLDRKPQTKVELAAKLGVMPCTLSQWMKTKEFAVLDIRAAMRARLLERVNEVVDNLANQASSPMGGAPEIKLYLQTSGLQDKEAATNVQVNQATYIAPADSRALAAVPEIKITDVIIPEEE